MIITKCNFCNNQAKYLVNFNAYRLGMSKDTRNRVTGTFNVVLCDSHVKTVNDTDLINSQNWNLIQSAMLSNGKPLLDRSTLEIEKKLIA